MSTAVAGPASAITDPLREALERRIESGTTVYRIAKDSHLDPGLVARFRSGERVLKTTSADRLASVLGLTLTPTTPTAP